MPALTKTTTSRLWWFSLSISFAVISHIPVYAQQSPSPEEGDSAAKISPRWQYSQRSIKKHRERTHSQLLKETQVNQISATSQAINNYLGTVVWVDAHHHTAVGYLESKFFSLENQVVTRNKAFEVTATLSPTSMQRGRAFGFEIVSGLPNQGDEIIQPNKAEAQEAKDR